MADIKTLIAELTQVAENPAKAVAELKKETGKKLSELAAEVQTYPQKLVNIRVSDKNGAMDVPAIKAIIDEVESEMNGDGRILVRPSGTEPLLRVMAEAPSQEKVNLYVDRIASVVKEEIGLAE